MKVDERGGLKREKKKGKFRHRTKGIEHPLVICDLEMRVQLVSSEVVM
jgi:hypothetical protein